MSMIFDQKITQQKWCIYLK